MRTFASNGRRRVSVSALGWHNTIVAEPESGANDEERGHIAVPTDRVWRALRHRSPLSFGLASPTRYPNFKKGVVVGLIAGLVAAAVPWTFVTLTSQGSAVGELHRSTTATALRFETLNRS